MEGRYRGLERGEVVPFCLHSTCRSFVRKKAPTMAMCIACLLLHESCVVSVRPDLHLQVNLEV